MALSLTITTIWTLLLCILPTNSVSQAVPPTSADDLKDKYYDIFPTGNRNAASHLWSSYVLNFSHLMPAENVENVFHGFCPVSGSPLPDEPERTGYKVKLAHVNGGTVTGVSRHCCWPCICDLHELVRIDTKTITTANGDRTYHFFVMGDPCVHEQKLDSSFTDPFSSQQVMLRDEAPELACENGKLRGAHFSDHGYVILGMFFTSDADINQVAGKRTPAQTINPADPTFGFGDICQMRKKQGYNSGMGLIFHLVANINPISVPDAPTLPPMSEEFADELQEKAAIMTDHTLPIPPPPRAFGSLAVLAAAVLAVTASAVLLIRRARNGVKFEPQDIASDPEATATRGSPLE